LKFESADLIDFVFEKNGKKRKKQRGKGEISKGEIHLFFFDDVRVQPFFPSIVYTCKRKFLTLINTNYSYHAAQIGLNSNSSSVPFVSRVDQLIINIAINCQSNHLYSGLKKKVPP
jgi:hypothetical protein